MLLFLLMLSLLIPLTTLLENAIYNKYFYSTAMLLNFELKVDQ